MRVSLRAWLPWLLAACASGCAGGPRVASGTRLSAGGAEVVVVTDRADDPGRAQVVAAVETALPAVTRWGAFNAPVRIRVMPSHDALTREVNRKGYAWLKAWARYDEVLIQSPVSWHLLAPPQSQVTEVMVHELTHSLMYQLAGTAETWRTRRIPLWFREGMASVTALQGYRWPSLENLARYYAEYPRRDPLARPEALYRDENDIVYAAGHHAFVFLVRRYGEDTVRALLTRMGEGLVFPEAFHEVVGLTQADFEADFRRYVTTRGFHHRRPAR